MDIKKIESIRDASFSKKVILKAKKGALMSLLGLCMGLSIGGCSKKNVTNDFANEVGYENPKKRDIKRKIKENEFVLLDVGDNDEIGVDDLDKKIKLCNKNDIACGLIVSSNSARENEIYDDVELIRGIINKYNIKMPVYLNIDYIIENNLLNIEQKTKIILDFLQKCDANSIYCGVYGKDSNLVRMKKYCNIVDYDACVVKEEDEIKYDGVYNIYKDLDGTLMATLDLEEVIDNKDLNNSEKFVSDGAYTVNEGDDINDIAMQYGMSVDELLKYNDIDISNVTNGTVLRVPVSINTVVPYSSSEFEYLKVPLKGLDISNLNSSNKSGECDWDEISKNYDFVILRSNYRDISDASFENFATNCSKYNVLYGVYNYTGCRGYLYDDIKDFEMAFRLEVKNIIDKLKNKKIDYPVYLDLEVDSSARSEIGKSLNDVWTEEQLNLMLDIWYDEISSNGYIPGVYCNKSNYNIINSKYADIDNFAVWIAGGEQYNQKLEVDQISEPSEDVRDQYGAGMYQVCEYAQNAGAKNSGGNVDFNYCYVDYANGSQNSDLSSKDNFGIKNIKRHKGIPVWIFTTEIIGSGVLVCYAMMKRKRNRGKSKTKKCKIKRY